MRSVYMSDICQVLTVWRCRSKTGTRSTTADRAPRRRPGRVRSQAALPRGRPSRAAVLPDQDEAPRAADPHRGGHPRATGQAHRAGGVRVRQPLVVRVCDRGDPPGAAAARRRRGVLAGGAGHRRDAAGAGPADPVVPPDDQGVPVRRRRLHRHQGQLRRHARAGRRCRAAHRLRAHRRGVDRGGCRRARLGLPGASHRGRSCCRSPSWRSSPAATSRASRSRAASSPCPPTSSSA